MTRAKRGRKPCDLHQARQRLADARQFLEAAELLDRTTQAGYESADISQSDSARCVEWATQLVAAAESRFET